MKMNSNNPFCITHFDGTTRRVIKLVGDLLIIVDIERERYDWKSPYEERCKKRKIIGAHLKYMECRDIKAFKSGKAEKITVAQFDRFYKLAMKIGVGGIHACKFINRNKDNYFEL